MKFPGSGLLAGFRPKAAASSESAPGYLVPPGTTIGQLLDALHGVSWDLGGFGSEDGRARGAKGGIMRYAPLHRCVNLICGVAASVLTNGGLSIRDANGDRVDNRATKQILELLLHSPDGELPPGQWFGDVMADLLLEGNALLLPLRGSAGRVLGVHRMNVWDATTIDTTSGSYAYRMRPVHKPGEVRTYTLGQVAHARWPLLLEGYGGQRYRFAPSPVYAIRKALAVALAGDEHVRRWFRGGGGNRATVGVSIQGRITEEQRQQLRTYLGSLTATESQGDEPLIMGDGATFTNLQQTVGGAMVDSLRAFQVREVSRLYGVPSVLLDDVATTWGSGIAELARLLWKFGASQHIERLLDALSLRLLPLGARFSASPMALVRGDPVALAPLITSVQGDAQRDPVMTREEIRVHLLGLDREPADGYPEKEPEPEPAPMLPQMPPEGVDNPPE